MKWPHQYMELVLLVLHVLFLPPHAAPNVRLVSPAMVAKEGIHRLAKLFRMTRPPSKSDLSELPLDIILMIVTYLDGCDLFSLALTCKSFYRLSERCRLSLQPAQKQKLLLLLEKDLPFLYYCHRCTRLHRWRGRRSKPITSWYKESLPCKRNPDHHLFLPPTCQIPYYHARLVMNRHLYGPEHGLPLETLKPHCFQQARIFNDQLMILSVISIKNQIYGSDALRFSIDYFNKELVCAHLTIKSQLYASLPRQVPELVDVPGKPLAYGFSFGSCIYCVTDYSIERQWRGAREKDRVEVKVYRWLGDCRSPFSWEWRTISKCNSGAKRRSAHSPKYKPGFVRQKWKEAEAAEEAVKCRSGIRKWF